MSLSARHGAGSTVSKKNRMGTLPFRGSEYGMGIRRINKWSLDLSPNIPVQGGHRKGMKGRV